MATAGGLLGSISSIFFKATTDTLANDGFSSGSLYLFMLFGTLSAALQLVFINKLMEVYEQVEIIPIYQSALILLNILAGAIVLNEAQSMSMA